MDESPSKKRRKAKFKEITTTLSKEELIRSLKTAAQELTNVEQGDSTSEFDQFTASLATSYIFKHRDKDVKSYAACCLADLLRIYAPEPPFNENQLKNIFRLMLQQLKGLENVQGPSYKRHFYLLESLALVKTFNVCMELEAHDIIIDLFKLFFSVVSEHHNIRVKNFMLDVMCPLIQEGDALPQEILDAILLHLIEPRKSKYKEAYKLACDLLDRCSASIEPYVQLFFNNTMVLGASVESDLGEHMYDLVYELYKVNKSVLLSVLPQLEFKLKGNEESERLQAVKLLGRMFANEDSSLAETNKALWNCYLGRFLDISYDVRVECIRMAKQFLLSSSTHLRSDVTDQLYDRFHDPDEKVRLETVITVCDTAVDNFDCVSDKLIEGVQERMRDKKWVIRKEAITCIGKLYKKIFASGNRNSMARMSCTPSKVLHLYQNTMEDRLCIERVLHGCFVPVSLNMEDRMKRLFDVYNSLDEVATKVLDGMLKYRAKVGRDFCALLESHQNDELTEKEKEKMLYRRTVAVARNLPEPYKTQEHLKKLMLLCSDKKCYQLLITCTDTKEECPKIIKAVTELIKKLTSKNPILDTVKSLLDRACPMLIDSPSFVILLKHIKKYIDLLGDDDDDDNDDEYELMMKGKAGLKLIQILANVQPTIFQSKACYEILLLFIKHNNKEVVEFTLKALEPVISELEDVDKNLCSCYQPVLSKLATHGFFHQAKYALRCLNQMLNDSTLVFERIFKNLLQNLNFDGTSLKLRSTIAAMSEIAKLAPNIFESKHKIIIKDFVVKELLITDREDSSNSEESEDEWCRDSDVSDDTLVKIEGIKLLTHWLLGLQSDEKERAKPVFRLFETLLSHDGDLSGNGKISTQSRSRLRLAASLAMLKLVQNVNFVDVITLEQYQQLALLMQDSCFEVREKFTAKLHHALESLQLSLDYMAFFVFVAVDPSKERKTKVKQMIAKNAQTRRDYSKLHSTAAARPYAILPEYSVPYVVHLLAHHPDFNPKDVKSLQEVKEYLWFYLEPIMGAKAENYSFLKKLLENIKQTRDKQDPDNETANEKMYAICDLAVTCIMTKNHTFTLKDFPGNLVLPRKLFIEDKTINSTKTYLPKGFIFSPKKKTPPLDVKVVSHSDDKMERKQNSASKRSVQISDDDNEGDESPRKKSRISSSTKKKKTTIAASEKEVKNVARNLSKSKMKSPIKKTLKSPLKRKGSPMKNSPKKIPLKSPKAKASPAKKTSGKKSPLTKVVTRNSPLKQASPNKSPMKRSSRRSPVKRATGKKQLKMDSFLNGKNKSEEDSEVEDMDAVVPDEKPASKSSKISPKKTVSRLRLAKKKGYENGMDLAGSDSDEIPLKELANSPKKNTSIQVEEKPEKLKIRRKQRTRR